MYLSKKRTPRQGKGRKEKGKRWKRQSFVTAGKIWLVIS